MQPASPQPSIRETLARVIARAALRKAQEQEKRR